MRSAMAKAAARIACLSLYRNTEQPRRHVQLPLGSLEWDTFPVAADLQLIRDRMPELLEDYDAVALDGLVSSFRIGEQRFRHDYIHSALELSALGSRFSDGTTLLATLERWLVRQAAEQLKPFISGKHILLFSGLSRYGSAEVLSVYSKHLLFGDLMYGFRLGIPITSLKAFVASAPQLARTVAITPASWYWPSARRSPRFMPRFQAFFRWADVIVGGYSYFQRYKPDSLRGKVIFTNLHGEPDLDLLCERKARAVVSLTPRINGEFVPLPVLEAGLRIFTGAGPGDDAETQLIDQLHRLDLRPAVYEFESPDEPELALVTLPKRPLAEVKPVALPQLGLSSADGVGRFCFVIHPLNFKHIARLPAVRALSSFVPHRLLEDAAAQLPPMLVGAVKNVVSPTGAKAEGLLYAVPMTSHAIMRFPPELLYRKLQRVAEDAQRQGCRLMGLGAYTSVVGDAGLTVSQRVSIGVTTGNSYTVAATMRTLEQAAQRSGIRLEQATGMVVGATGSIGSICARLLARQVRELLIVGPRPERLLALARQLEQECPQLSGNLHMARQATELLPRADLIITTTSAVDPVVDVATLKPGCVVCDVARPPDIKPEAAAARDDILVIESGEIRLLPGAEVTMDIGLPRGVIYACLAETLLLALEQRFGHYTLGREIDPQRVEEIGAIGDRHGFVLADVRSFGKPISDARFARLAQINVPRFARQRY
jgi:predicted amino acid dehydrogenase